MPADPEPHFAKYQRQRQRDIWLRQGLDIDEIARRFRRACNVGALTAYRWANNLTQLEVANTYSEQFMDGEDRLYPQRVSEFEKWPHEQGGREPPLSLLERFAKLYHTTPNRLIAAVLEQDAPAAEAGNLPATGDSAATARPLTIRHAPPQPWTMLGTGGRGQVGTRRLLPATIDSAEQITQGFRQMYHASAGVDIFPAVAQHTELVCRWFRSARKPKDRKRLGATAGELALLTGRILFFDRDDRATAVPYYEQTLEIAEEIGDHALQACVLAHLSRVPATDGRGQEALDFLDGAQRLAAEYGSALLRAWIAAVAAKTHATTGVVEHAVAALDSAKELLDQQGTAADPVWLDYFDWSRLYGFEGFCLRVCDPEVAQAALQKGLDLLDRGAIKERACMLADLAATYLPLGQPETMWSTAEIEEACRVARQSVALLAETGYATGLQRVDELRAWLTPRHGDVAAVRELVELLRDVRILKARSNSWVVDG